MITNERSNSQKAIFILTDGDYNMGVNPILISQKLKLEGTSIFFIIVGGLASTNEIKNFVYYDQIFFKNKMFVNKNFNICIEIRNIGKNDIPSNSTIKFKENSQILTSIIKIEQNISPNMVAYIQGTIFTKQNSKISDLNRFLDFNIYYPSENKKIFCKYDRIALSTELFIGSFLEWKLPADVPAINILIFGIMGSGKSSFINTVITSLSETIEEQTVIGGSLDHVTNKYEMIQLKPKIGIKINMFDSWGVSGPNYENTNMLNYFLDGLIPDEFPMEKVYDIQFVEETIKNNYYDAYKRKIHAVAMFINIDTEKNQEVKNHFFF
jgi:hypothetical protein